MYRAEEVIVIVNSFENLFNALNRLTDHIEKLNLPFVIQKGNKFVRDKLLLLYALRHMSSEQDLSVTETYARPGAIACTRRTLELVEKLNLAKNEFKAVVSDYNKRHGLVHCTEVRDMLLKAGYGLVRIKEAWRQFVIVDHHPQYISWCKGFYETRPKKFLSFFLAV